MVLRECFSYWWRYVKMFVLMDICDKCLGVMEQLCIDHINRHLYNVGIISKNFGLVGKGWISMDLDITNSSDAISLSVIRQVN